MLVKGFTPRRDQFQERELVDIWMENAEHNCVLDDEVELGFKEIVEVVECAERTHMLLETPVIEAVALLSFYTGREEIRV